MASSSRSWWGRVWLLLAAGCAAAPARWHDDLQAALQLSRSERRECVVCFLRPGVELSEHLRAGLGDAEVLAALREGDFVAVVASADTHARLHDEWLGGRDGFGVAVLDAQGSPYAGRPGPQDADELAAFVRTCAARREVLASRRAMVEQPAVAPLDQHALGCLYLELGCRRKAEEQLIPAATAGVVDARHRLARLHALDGNVEQARRWLQGAPGTPAAKVTEGYVLFKEREFARAAKVLHDALQAGRVGDDRQFAMLYLGKAWHEDRRDDLAVPLLESLAAEGTGSVAEAGARHVLRHVREGTRH